jgi:hypothetical protein
MPILEVAGNRSSIRRVAAATALGAIFGFQCWRLAEYLSAVRIPWYGSLWILFNHVLLGLSIGVTTRFVRWWERGLVLGLAFSAPLALGARALGLRWAPYGISVIVAGLVAGLLIAFAADEIVPRSRISAGRHSSHLEAAANAGSVRLERPASEIQRRLTEGKAALERLQSQRQRRGNSAFGKAEEDRIVWGELLELELQDIDEQVSRICDGADGAPSKPNPRAGPDEGQSP